MKNNVSLSDSGWNLQSSYTQISDKLFSELKPDAVTNPSTVIVNNELAEKLGLNLKGISEEDLSNLFSGNSLPHGSKPFAQAYAGHQFGQFTILGDGRAHIVGEQVTPDGEIFDIQYKGSGRTPYSRGGDGKAALGPMLREYLISEAMYYLGIPTTRSLAVVETGEKVYREVPLKGSILTRVASSHIRIGTFQFLAAHKDYEGMKSLLDFSIKRHFSNLKFSENLAIEFIKAVMQKQINLIVEWMRVGFIHGVMNTDNSTISGETIDYGPCAFMDQYDANTVFSSIDTQGRYSFANQPSIIQWNLVRLAECLLPLIDKDEKRSIEIAQNLINTFSSLFKDKWLQMMKKKLGIKDQSEDDEELINNLIKWMQQKKPDFTNTFCNLMNYDHADDEEFEDDEFNNWKREWKKRVESKEYLDVMMSCNPILIPRNYLVEEALSEAETDGKFDKFNELNEIISSPYQLKKVNIKYLETPSKTNIPYKTFCGT
ncbi:MAG: UPF0061 protein [Candidatus Pelagibacterales bacterium]|nr:MAG: UPF0061 protein [Pelagibacterales bacterium]